MKLFTNSLLSDEAYLSDPENNFASKNMCIVDPVGQRFYQIFYKSVTGVDERNNDNKDVMLNVMELFHGYSMITPEKLKDPKDPLPDQFFDNALPAYEILINQAEAFHKSGISIVEATSVFMSKGIKMVDSYKTDISHSYGRNLPSNVRDYVETISDFNKYILVEGDVKKGDYDLTTLQSIFADHYKFFIETKRGLSIHMNNLTSIITDQLEANGIANSLFYKLKDSPLFEKVERSYKKKLTLRI